MNFSVEFSNTALEDYEYWVKSNNIKVVNKIKLLLKNMQVAPFSGLGKPEVLKYNLTGYWSRRITREDRIVYKVANKTIYVIQLRGHY